tara:strand:- start:2064 stop:3542 length:1479 start_codon:yes stop_codon:yes gene_type:complete
MKFKGLENYWFTVVLLLGLISIYVAIMVSCLSGTLSYLNFGTLTIPSVFLFIVCVFISSVHSKYYFSILAFILLAFPSPIDDIFPSVTISNLDDLNTVVFPIITRIDVFLIFGIILKVIKTNFKVQVLKLPLIIKLFILMWFAVFIINLLFSKDVLDFNLLLAYSYHIRYFILLLILINLYDINVYKKQLIFSLLFSVFFLLIEAYVNSNIKGLDRLSSGSLSLNTFANISAALGVYFIILLRKGLVNRLYGFFGLGIVIVIMIASGTRGAFITMGLSYFLFYFIENPNKMFKNTIRVGLGFFAIIAVYFIMIGKGFVPERYSYEEITKNIEIDFSKDHLNEQIKIRVTPETTSIKSRIDLFDASINMIKENSLFGIGSGRWNRYKNKYSSNNNVPKVLLDSHNDYLALWSQYGIPLGSVFAFVIFLYPLVLFKRIKTFNNGPLSYLFVINLTMGIAAISNSGFFKHQVAALLMLCVCIPLKLARNEKETIR